MNKKLNTILFLVGITIINILIITFIFFITFIPVTYLLNYFMGASSLAAYFKYIGFVLLLVSIICAYFIYRFIMKKISLKIDLEKYFEPLFGRKKE